jgi:hypothetical protein
MKQEPKRKKKSSDIKLNKEILTDSDKEMIHENLKKVINFILKICGIVFLILPFSILSAILLAFVLFGIYLLTVGTPIYGIVIFLFGLFLFLTFEIKRFTDFFYFHKRNKIYPVIISFVLMLLSVPFVLDTVFSFHYYEKVDDAKTYASSVEEYTLDGDFFLNYDEVVIDNSLNDDTIKIEIVYNDEIITLQTPWIVLVEGGKRYEVEYVVKDNLSMNDWVLKTIVPSLKNHVLYLDYVDPYVRVYVNSKTESRVFYQY